MLVTHDGHWRKSTAALKILNHLGGFWRLFYLFTMVPLALRDRIYDAIARHRYRLRGHGSLGTAGSVGWQFDRKGQIYVGASRYTEDAVFEAAIEAGADDVESTDDEFIVTTDAGSFHEVQAGMRSAGIEFERAELVWIPQNEIRVEGRDAEKLIKLMDALDDIDDVQQISSNADIDEEILAQAM